MTKTQIKNRINVLEAKLRYVAQYDLWNRWSWEEDKELRELKAKLLEFEIK